MPLACARRNLPPIGNRREAGVPSLRSEPQEVTVVRPVPDDGCLEAVQLRTLADEVPVPSGVGDVSDKDNPDEELTFSQLSGLGGCP